MNNYILAPGCQVVDLDKIYLNYFGYKKDGFFVDVGAYDGYNFSNTYGLADAGWGGICYEPIQQFYIACLNAHKDHPKVKTIQTCIGNKKGSVTMTFAGTLSTYSEYYANTKYWENDYKTFGYKTPSRIITLDESLQDNNVQPNFDVLNIDVEGSETDVLECFDIDYWKPKMAIVEAQEIHEAVELRNQAPFINQYFEKAGYKKIYCDQINNIYVI